MPTVLTRPSPPAPTASPVVTSAGRAARTHELTLANRLRPLLLHLARHLRRTLDGTTVTGGQIEILALLDRGHGVGINEMAAREGISAPSMSNAVDKLEAAGLATRTRGAVADRRRVEVTLTESGSRLLRSVRSNRTAWLAERLRRLTPEQRAALEAAVEPLAALVEDDRQR